jgi:uncharacterized protein YdhG (YjbR/CyaY superfamily)
MQTKQAAPQTIDAYVAAFPSEIQEILEKIRATIKKAAPEAEEAISYGMPTFNWKGHYLVYFAAHKKHVSVYPAPMGVPDFEKELALYAAGKGTLQFPYDKPIPYNVITKVVKYWVKANTGKAAAGTKTK